LLLVLTEPVDVGLADAAPALARILRVEAVVVAAAAAVDELQTAVSRLVVVPRRPVVVAVASRSSQRAHVYSTTHHAHNYNTHAGQTVGTHNEFCLL